MFRLRGYAGIRLQSRSTVEFILNINKTKQGQLTDISDISVRCQTDQRAVKARMKRCKAETRN